MKEPRLIAHRCSETCLFLYHPRSLCCPDKHYNKQDYCRYPGDDQYNNVVVVRDAHCVLRVCVVKDVRARRTVHFPIIDGHGIRSTRPAYIVMFAIPPFFSVRAGLAFLVQAAGRVSVAERPWCARNAFIIGSHVLPARTRPQHK
mgnify:CR=1 FL=1